MADINFNGGKASNMADAKFEQDGINLRTLRRYSSILTANTISTVVSGITSGANISISGTSSAITISVNPNIVTTSINAGTILSAGTNLYDIFLTTNNGNDITRVQPGSNITTGGTANNPIVNVSSSPSFNSITASGDSSFTTLSATTLVSGSTNLYNIFSTTDTNDITRVQPGLNTYTGGTANSPTVNISAATLNYLSATTISAGTYYGDGSNLSGISTDNFYTTGATLVGNTAFFNRNDQLSAYTLSFSALNIGQYWTSGSTGLNSIKAINSTSLDSKGNYAVAFGNATSAISESSFAIGVNSIASASETVTINTATPITIYSSCTITLSDPNNSTSAIVFSGDVSTEWGEYYYSYCSTFTLYGGMGSDVNVDCSTLVDLYYDFGTDSTYIVDSSIVDNTFLNISGDTFYNVVSYSVNSKPAFSMGTNVKAYGINSHAEGNATIASGITSHAEGDNTQASGDYSHAEGGYTIASGAYSHGEGGYTIASGEGAHAEGVQTRAIGDYSHAEGASTFAIGNYAHSEGRSTSGSGYASHAEGDTTIASGNWSHVEGELSKSLGQWSHAGGRLTIASGDTSFVHGSASTANAFGTIVLGNGITGNSANTTYVNKLNIKNLFSGTNLYNLGIDSSGNIVTGSTDNFYTTAVTLNNNIAYFNRNDLLSAYTLDLSIFSAATFTGTTNYYSKFNSGGTIQNGIIYDNGDSGVFIAPSGNNASLNVVSPAGFYYPELGFYNNASNYLGGISAYGASLYISGAGAPITPIIVSSVVQFPYLYATANTLTYVTSANTLQTVTLGSGLDFSTGGTLSITGGSGGGSPIQNGLNTYTGGTLTAQTINVSALTIDNISVSGNSLFNVFSATTLSATTAIFNTATTNVFSATTLNATTAIFNTATTNTLSATTASVTTTSNLYGSINTSFTGTASRFVESSSGGTLSATKEFIDSFLIPSSTPAVLLSATSGWTGVGIYTGTTITGTYQGQQYYNSSYYFVCVDDNDWIRLVRG